MFQWQSIPDIRLTINQEESEETWALPLYILKGAFTMDGQDIINIIRELGLEGHEACEESSLRFEMAMVRNPADYDDVKYIDLVIDLHSGDVSLEAY